MNLAMTVWRRATTSRESRHWSLNTWETNCNKSDTRRPREWLFILGALMRLPVPTDPHLTNHCFLYVIAMSNIAKWFVIPVLSIHLELYLAKVPFGEIPLATCCLLWTKYLLKVKKKKILFYFPWVVKLYQYRYFIKVLVVLT